MMKQWVLLFLVVFSLLPNVFADGIYSDCDVTANLSDWSLGGLCPANDVSSSLTLYGRNYNIANMYGYTGQVWIRVLNNDNQSEIVECQQIDKPTQTGEWTVLLKHGYQMPSSAWPNFVFYTSSSCSGGSPGFAMRGDNVGYLTGTWYWDNPATPFLSFPLPDYTPYDASISSIFDHSTNGGFYNKNGVIRAYNGEEADDDYYSCYDGPCNIKGYRKDASGTPFSIPLLGGYDDADTSDYPDSPKNILWYDGHPGYDYPSSQGTDIKATHSGILCVASNRTSSGGGLMWRNSTYCQYARDVLSTDSEDDSWDDWHAFYIVYPNTGYSTWYLHAGVLDEDVEDDILSQGYSMVTQNDVVAAVGNQAPIGVSVGYHVHFEVRINGETPVDPYGDGSVYRLWEDEP